MAQPLAGGDRAARLGRQCRHDAAARPPLHAGGYSVLLIDARNHGNSDADSFSSMPRFAEDLEAAFAWLASRPRIEAARIAVLGHSVGAAAALLAASREPRIAAVVSIAAFAHPAR